MIVSARARRMLLILTLLNLSGIVVATLAPFHAPANMIQHVPGRGLLFGDYGTVLSDGPFLAPAPERDSRPVAIEFWMLCRYLDDSNTFFAFHDSIRGVSVSFHQRTIDFAIARWTLGDLANPGSHREMTWPQLYRAAHPVFLTVVSDGRTTEVYADGVFTGSHSNFGFVRGDLAGRRVVFDQPYSTSSWGGDFRGFAVYEARLDAESVRRHYESWTKTGRPHIEPADRAAAVFLFDESSGSLLKNSATGASDLRIPPRYMVVDQTRFNMPSRIDWKDAAKNIMGFISFGLLLNASFTVCGMSRPATLAILLSLILTLTVEAIQSVLPTRDSSLADVLSNTIGGAAGGYLFQWSGWARRLLQGALERFV